MYDVMRSSSRKARQVHDPQWIVKCVYDVRRVRVLPDPKKALKPRATWKQKHTQM